MRKIILSTAIALFTLAAVSCQKDKKVPSNSEKEQNVKMKTIDAELSVGDIHTMVLSEVRRLHPTDDTTVGIDTMTQWVVYAYDSMFNDTINEITFASALKDHLSALHVLDVNQNFLVPSISLPIITGSFTNPELAGAFDKIHAYKGHDDIVSYAAEQLDIEGLSSCEQQVVEGYLSVLESSSHYWAGANDTTRYLYNAIAEADADGYADGYFWGFLLSGGDTNFAKRQGCLMAIAYSQNCKCVHWYE